MVGSFGNLWDGIVNDGEISNYVDTKNLPHISIMVNAFTVENEEKGSDGKDVSINFESSPDGEHWTFCNQITENLPQGGQSEAHIFETIGVRYVRLKRAEDDGGEAYIESTIQAKP